MSSSLEEQSDYIVSSLKISIEDSAEAAQFELENAHYLIHGERSKQRKSSLIEKLKADPEQSFSISRFSEYGSNRWVLERRANATDLCVLFNSDMAGGNELKKMLVYHLIPQFHPLGRVRSYQSTTTYSWAYSLIEEYLFKPNGLDATPESIRAVSVRLVNEALDRARDKGTPRHYFLLYFIVSFWQTLSAQSLIPESRCLNLSMRLIDTKDRQNDIQNTIASEHKGWQSYSEDELSRLIEYAFFWAVKAIPTLLSIRDFLEMNGAAEQNHRHFIRTKEWREFEALLGQEVDGVKVCGFGKVKYKSKIISPTGRVLEYPGHHYRWRQNYAQAIDKVRDGVLILIALISGMRRRELGAVTFEDITQREDGKWHIKVTRFKTSDDPNYFGESELLPLPSFIGECVSEYKKLRSFDRFMRKGLLFEQVANSREAKVLDRSAYRALRNLSDVVGVVGVHPHRFRKTIAEILINRSERNIDLIRMLFGHRSFTMTLRYIARNPYLVTAIAETMEEHYTKDFVDIVTAVQTGSYSGIAAERIAQTTSAHPELFKGRLLRMTVLNYIAYLLEVGEPIFIKRTGVGMYCISSDSYSKNSLPPCLAKAGFVGEDVTPNPSNCQLDCKNAVVLEAATDTLQRNIAFYTRLLEQSSEKLRNSAKRQLIEKIGINEKHLTTLIEKKNAAMNRERGTFG